MRMIVFFDLPVTTAAERKSAARFRNFLLKDGYYMVQFSVYSKVCNGTEATEKHAKRIKDNLPEKGSVRVLTITEKQYQNMLVLLGEVSVNERPFQAEQLTFF